MLVLSRKKDEKIIIGGNIELMVIDIQHDTVRIGIEAPREVIVDREEIHLLKQQSKEAENDSAKPI